MRREDLEGQRVPQSQSDLFRAFDDAILGRTIRRSNKSSWKIELPKFSGRKGEDPSHYFMKMITFFQGYELDSTGDKVRAFLGSLEGEALDLYLTLDYGKQGDVKYLRDIFETHFKPAKHRIIGMSEFLKIRKGASETMSEFYLRLRKSATKEKIGEEVLQAVFLQGVPSEYQRHLALKDLRNLDEMVDACLELEQVLGIGAQNSLKEINAVSTSELEILRRQMDKVNEKLENILQSNAGQNQKTSYMRNYQIMGDGYDNRNYSNPGNRGGMNRAPNDRDGEGQRSFIPRGNQQQYVQRNYQQRNFGDGNLDNQRNFIPRTNQQQSMGPNDQNNPRQPYPANNRNMTNQAPKMDQNNAPQMNQNILICYYCGKRGHFRRDCWELAKFIGEKRQDPGRAPMMSRNEQGNCDVISHVNKVQKITETSNLTGTIRNNSKWIQEHNSLREELTRLSPVSILTAPCFNAPSPAPNANIPPARSASSAASASVPSLNSLFQSAPYLY